MRDFLPTRASGQRDYQGLARVAWAVAALFVSGCASILDEDGALTAVPYRISDSGQIVVDAVINDEGPFTFAFDTGASISVVFDDVRKAVGLECLPDREVVIQGMVGSGRFPIATIEELRLGSEIWADAHLASMPGGDLAATEIDGILGVDLLDRYAVSFSTKEKALRFYAPESVRERAYRGWAVVPLRELSIGGGDSTVFVVDIKIGAVVIPALLDLGASPNIMNWQAAEALRVKPLAPRQPGEISGVVGTTPLAAQLEIRKLKTGGLRWFRKTFIIADYSIFSALGLEDQPTAIVGADLFSRRDFVIDFARQRLLVRTSD